MNLKKSIYLSISLIFFCFIQNLNCQCSWTYTIQSGDTFEAIAKRYGVDLNSLLAANGNRDPRALYPGQTICIPGSNNGQWYPNYNYVQNWQYGTNCANYQIKSGDTCNGLTGYNPNLIYQYNPGISCDNLRVGQFICLPNYNGYNSGYYNPYSNCGRVYTVVQNDFCYFISQKVGITLDQLQSCNPGVSCSNLWPGQVLRY